MTLAVVILLLTLPSGTLAAPTQPAITAPYNNVLSYRVFAGAAGGACTGASMTLPVQFNLTTGVARGIGRANGTGCQPGFLGSFGTVDESLTLATNPVRVTSPGPLTVRSAWKIVYASNITITNVSATSYAWADFAIEIEVVIRDLTNNTSFEGRTQVLAQGVIGYANSSLSASGTLTGTANLTVTVAPGHAYRFDTDVAVLDTVYVSGGFGAHARLITDWGSPGHYARLVSLTVS